MNDKIRGSSTLKSPFVEFYGKQCFAVTLISTKTFDIEFKTFQQDSNGVPISTSSSEQTFGTAWSSNNKNVVFFHEFGNSDQTLANEESIHVKIDKKKTSGDIRFLKTEILNGECPEERLEEYPITCLKRVGSFKACELKFKNNKCNHN